MTALPLAIIGCGGSASHNPDAAADAFVTVTTETGTIKDQVTGMPIAGARMCLDGLAGTPCATSQADGTYTLQLALEDGVFRFAQVTTATGYLGRENLMVEDVSPDSIPGRAVWWEDIGGLYSAAEATTYLANQAGFTYPSDTTGFVQLLVLDGTSPVAATVSISPAAGSGPVYFNGNMPDPTQTDASRGPNVLLGNLPPGTYAITVQAAGKTCTVFPGGDMTHGAINGEWPPVGGETLSVGVTANALTDGLAVQCQ